jgi:hypothetical protein
MLIELEQVAVGVIEEEHMPFAFSRKPYARRYEFYALCVVFAFGSTHASRKEKDP